MGAKRGGGEELFRNISKVVSLESSNCEKGAWFISIPSRNKDSDARRANEERRGEERKGEGEE